MCNFVFREYAEQNAEVFSASNPPESLILKMEIRMFAATLENFDIPIGEFLKAEIVLWLCLVHIHYIYYF
jgi:hypothetical protein